MRHSSSATGSTDEELPEGWVVAPLKDLGADIPYPIGDGDHGQIKPSFYQSSGVPYIRVADIGWGRLNPAGMVYIPEEVHTANLKSELRPGDVIIAKTGATIGKCAIIPPTILRANTTSSVGKVTVNKQILTPEWLLYYFLTDQFRADMWAVSEKTAQPGFSNRSLEAFRIPVAPITEQQRIVDRVTDLFEKLDRAQARLDKLRLILPRLRKSVLAAASSGELTTDWRALRESDAMPADLPVGWRVDTVGNLSSKEPRSIQSGPFGSNLLHSEFQPTGVLAIGIDNVLDGVFSLGRQHRISPEKFKELAKYRARPGDVLITVMGTIGRVCVVPEDIETSIITKHVYRITTDRSQLDPHYLMFSLMGDPLLTHDMANQVRGQTRPGINGVILKGLRVRVPPLEEQHEIVRRVEHILSLADQLGAHVRTATGKTDRLRQAILARAYRGELVATDAEIAAKKGSSFKPVLVMPKKANSSRKRASLTKRRNKGRNMPKSGGNKIPRRSIVETLREQGRPLTPERLFDLAGFDESTVDVFYGLLRHQIEEGLIREVRPNKKDVHLEAVTA